MSQGAPEGVGFLHFWDRNGRCHFQGWKKIVPIIFPDQCVDSDLRAGHWKLVYKFIWDADFNWMAPRPLKNINSCINISVYSKIQRNFLSILYRKPDHRNIQTISMCFPDRHYCLKIFLTSLLIHSATQLVLFGIQSTWKEGKHEWLQHRQRCSLVSPPDRTGFDPEGFFKKKTA